MITPTELRELSNKFICIAKTEFSKEIDKEVDRLLQMCKRVAANGATFKTIEYYCEHPGIHDKLGNACEKTILQVIKQKLEIAGYRVSLNTNTYHQITISWY